MIPKKIHYIWLGSNPLNNTSKMCINSWRRVYDDYQIIMWNEENLNLKELRKNNRFLDECLKNKLWAFASDYLRLHILFTEGGIYMDTDVEALKPMDKLLNNSSFIGLEHVDYIGTGVIGAEKHNKTIKRLLKFYDNEIWNVDFFNNPIIFRYLLNNDKQAFEGCEILESTVFSPYDPYIHQEGLIGDENTICIHWYNASWGMTRKGYVFLMTKHVKEPICKVYQTIRKNFGYYRKRKQLNP